MTEPIATHKPTPAPLADLENAPCFIETQFPVAKISSESYKERKAGGSQTLVGLGNWKGRKPLVLVRAALLGLLLPATADPAKDREIFLKLMTMDAEGLLRRKSKPIPAARLLEELAKLPSSLRERYLASDGASLARLSREEKDELQRLVFERLPYSEKLDYCDRPEQIDGPSPQAWAQINAHLGTTAGSLSELVEQLGRARFGRRPRVGDAFCGGGSIPFEAARLGCDTYGSDLNPVAALLTWAALNLVGGGEALAAQVRQAQEDIYHAVDRQVTEWGIEHNSLGWRADAYLYCVEVTDPESGWKIPLLPTLAIGEKPRVIARLVPDEAQRRYEIEIIENASPAEYAAAEKAGTVKDSRLVPPGGGAGTPIEVLRRDLRLWEKSDFTPRAEDVFQERLYCIRWVETIANGKTLRHYRAPNTEDLKRERRVIELLAERFGDWQAQGYLPSRAIEPGAKTDEPIRTRGWTHWHHLFTPRQLLIFGSLSQRIRGYQTPGMVEQQVQVGLLTGLGKCCDLSSRLSRWHYHRETIEQTLYNQAFNTMYNYATRGYKLLEDHFIKEYSVFSFETGEITPLDCRAITAMADVWITDPPYADAVNYDEISEFFLAWEESHIRRIFPSWTRDSRRELAVRSSGGGFNQSMVECYRRLTEKMPDNGMQIVMFTHQDAGVWADLTMILWAAGLRVTAAWTIATETDAIGIKKGNNVQGTVLLVLRKRANAEPLFLDEVSHQVEEEVRRQLDEMTRLEDDSDPNFGDADYQLAAYAAALRVLTGQPIEEIDPEKEILRQRKPGEVSQVEELIRRAVKIACDHLIPRGIPSALWKTLGAMERFYIKGLEVESHGEFRSGVYQELARGFGATDYTDLLESTRANETRLKNASEFGRKMLGTFGASPSFNDSLTRQCLFAVWLAVKNEDTREAMDYLHTELRDAYWTQREKITAILDFLGALSHAGSMQTWHKDARAAVLLAGAVRNDHV